MKRILALLAIATAGMAASVSAAQAEVITNEWTQVSYSGFVPCANGGAGEILSGTIDMHDLMTATVNGNNTSWQFQFQPKGNVVGTITGDAYRVSGVTHGTFNESSDGGHYTGTYVSTFHLIGPGSGNNFRLHEIDHVTIDGDGNVVVQHDDLSVDCS
jgi:hypothetical protein